MSEQPNISDTMQNSMREFIVQVSSAKVISNFTRTSFIFRQDLADTVSVPSAFLASLFYRQYGGQFGTH